MGETNWPGGGRIDGEGEEGRIQPRLRVNRKRRGGEKGRTHYVAWEVMVKIEGAESGERETYDSNGCQESEKEVKENGKRSKSKVMVEMKQ